MTERRLFYVKAILTISGRVKGYGVYDDNLGKETEHQRFERPDYEPGAAWHLANVWRDDANTATGEA